MRCVNLDEVVTATFYDSEHDEFYEKTGTIEEILSICDSYTEIEAEPIRHSMRKDENGVMWVFGEHGWEKKKNEQIRDTDRD